MGEVFAVMRYMGAPYRHMGRGIDGLDCWGLIKLVYKEMLKVELWDIGEEYPEDWSFAGRDLFMENYRKQWAKVAVPEIYDVVLIKNGGGTVNHAGIMINNQSFLHCIKAGAVVSRVTDKIWKPRIAGYFRYKGKNGQD